MEKLFFFLAIFFSFPFHSAAQLQLLNDEFEDSSTLSNWQNITDVEGWNTEHLEAHDINITQTGKLTMMPYTSSWFQDYRGTILFKEVTGDFIISTEVTATNRAGTGIPSSDYSLAGVMIRAPRSITNGAMDWTSGGENYVFLATGQANDQFSNPSSVGPHFEVKTTTNSNSNLAVNPIPTSSNVQIRLARIGNFVICLYQLPGGNWTVHRRFNRADFPQTMQIGFVTYTDWPKVSSYDPIFQNSNVLNDDLDPDPSSNPWLSFNPDLIGGFEYARFDSVHLPTPLIGANLANASVSDSELLSFLGFESQAYTTYIEVDINVILQGPYDSNAQLMTDGLRQSGFIPNVQPYNVSPWNYEGIEMVGTGVLNETTNDAIVDWVLVELRDKNNASSVLASAAALLQRDGDVVDAQDGQGAVRFEEFAADDYFVAIRHRNHLGCMSLNAIPLSSSPTSVDFTSISTYGTNSQHTINGLQVLWSGDATSDGTINASDRSATWNQRNQNAYLGADVNMDGNCNAADRSTAWNNRNRGEQIP